MKHKDTAAILGRLDAIELLVLDLAREVHEFIQTERPARDAHGRFVKAD